MYRDFSENSKNELLRLVQQVENDKLCNFTDWAGDRWYDFETWIGALNIRNYLNNVNAYHRKVIDKNNATRDTINSIFQKVGFVDNFYRIKFYALDVQLLRVKQYIDEMSAIVEPTNGNFNATYISSTLGRLFEEYSEFLRAMSNLGNGFFETTENADIIGNRDLTSFFMNNRDSTIDNIALFWTSDWLSNALSYFYIPAGITPQEFFAIASKAFLENISNPSFGNIMDSIYTALSERPESIQLGENVNEKLTRESIESLVESALMNKHEVTDATEKGLKHLTPEEAELGKKVIDYFIKSGKAITEEEMSAILKIDIKDIKESDYLNWLCQKENTKFLESLSGVFDKVGTVADGVDYVEIGATALARFFNDYTEDAEYMRAIQTTLVNSGVDNKVVDKVVEEILWEYENQYIAGVQGVAEELGKKAAEEGTKELLKLISADAATGVTLFLSGKDIVNGIIGLEDTTKSLSSVYATAQYTPSLIKQYNYYRDKVNSGNYTEEDVRQRDMYFRIAREAKLQEYKGIKKVTEDALNSPAAFFQKDEDKEYTRSILVEIDAEIQRLQNITIGSDVPLDATV